MVIARTASRNVAFKVATMRDFIMEGQHEFIMRRTDSNGLESEAENKEALEDLTYNADLFFANQEEVNTNTVHVCMYVGYSDTNINTNANANLSYFRSLSLD